MKWARLDLIKCRDVPDEQEPKVLVATGDSVTAAFHQNGFGVEKCANVTSDHRGLKGNDAWFSYAGQYFKDTPDIAKYYNFARSGFGTDEIVGNITRDDTDTCGNKWGQRQKYTPIALAREVIKQAKEDQLGAYFVTTGGANNTNWVEVLAAVTECRALEYLNGWLENDGMTWGRSGKAKIVTDGGACQLAIQTDEDTIWIWRVPVPAYNGPAVYPTITQHARQISQTMLNAGADKVIWMLYYDITVGNIDVGSMTNALYHAHSPNWLQEIFDPDLAPFLFPIVDPVHVTAVQKMVNDINDAVTADLPHDQRLTTVYPALKKDEIQVTAIGGCPHPSQAGHAKLARALKGIFP